MEEKQTYRRPYTIPKTVVIKVEFESWLLGRSLFQNPGGGGHNSAEDEDFIRLNPVVVTRLLLMKASLL